MNIGLFLEASRKTNWDRVNYSGRPCSDSLDKSSAGRGFYSDLSRPTLSVFGVYAVKLNAKRISPDNTTIFKNQQSIPLPVFTRHKRRVKPVYRYHHSLL